jgi:hypothetical protein
VRDEDTGLLIDDEDFESPSANGRKSSRFCCVLRALSAD